MLDNLLSLLFPEDCLLCKSYSKILCTDCQTHLKKICLSHFAKKTITGCDQIYCSWNYKVVRQIIKQAKYKQRHELIRFLTKIALENVLINFSEYDLIIPIPEHPNNLKIRNYSPTYLIVKALGFYHKIDPGIVRHTGTGIRQALTSRRQRSDNATKNFIVQNKLRIYNKRLLLVDDVITTGASLAVIASQLSAAGAKNISAYSLAGSSYITGN